MWFALFITVATAADLLIENVRVVDARGDSGIHAVLIQQDRIARIDPKELPPDVERLDGTGHTLLPGFIDAHVHITMSPGEAFREENPEQRAQRVAHHLRAFLAMGITSIVDPGIHTGDVDLVRSLQAKGAAPNVFVVGPLLGPEGGYPSKVVKVLPGVGTPEEVRQQLDAFESYETYGVKVTFEDGMLSRVMPLFSEEMQESIAQEVSARDLKLYIHATDVRGIRRALQMKPHVLVHGPHKYNGKLLGQIAASGAYVVSTIDILGAGLTYFDMEGLDDPRMVAVVPEDERAAAQDPGVRKQFIDEAWRASAPGWPRWMGRMLYKKSTLRPRVNAAIRGIRKLHERGVPIALGSDSSGWPLVPFLFHGISTHLEMSFLSQAGFTPLEIIEAGTRTPARMLGKEAELGTVETGKRADLILVKGDPLTDLSVLRHPAWVIYGGELRTAEGWMETVGE